MAPSAFRLLVVAGLAGIASSFLAPGPAAPAPCGRPDLRRANFNKRNPGRLAVSADANEPAEAVPPEVAPPPASEADLAKEALLDACAPILMGFKSTAAERKDVRALIEALLEKAPAPAETTPADLDGRWRLVFSDAPDILGLRGGPLSELVFIGQDIDGAAGTVDNVIEYMPSQPMRSLFGSVGIDEDRIEQRVLLKFECTGGNTVNLKVSGTKLVPKRVFGGRISADRLQPPALQGPLTLPFGKFDVLYNDGDLRIVRTGPGYYGVNQRY